MYYSAYIGLGSNLRSIAGTPAATVRAALTALRELGSVVAVSSLYLSAPVGLAEQPDFINAAATLDTDLQPAPLLHALLDIERRFGRVRQHTAPKGPRTLDLDLLLMFESGGKPVIADLPHLKLPHPEIARRAFVLEPLAEIAPNLRHPDLGATTSVLLREYMENGKATRIARIDEAG